MQKIYSLFKPQNTSLHYLYTDLLLHFDSIHLTEKVESASILHNN